MCADQPPNAPLLPCGKAQNCNPSKAELKEAKAAYNKGLKLEKTSQTEEALAEFETAAELAPHNVQYATAREIVRQQLVSERIQRGSRELATGNQKNAVAAFRSALALDADNQIAQERLQEMAAPPAPQPPPKPEVLSDAGEVRAFPNRNVASFHYRGDSKALLSDLASVYGLTAIVDESVMSRRLRFDLTDANFYTAIDAACAVSHCFWSPVSEKQIVIAP